MKLPAGGPRSRMQSFQSYNPSKRHRIGYEDISSAMQSSFVQFFCLSIFSILIIVLKPSRLHWLLRYIFLTCPVFYLLFYYKVLLLEVFLSEHLFESYVGTFEWFTAVDDNLILGALPLMELHIADLQKLNIATVISVVESFELTSPMLLATPITPTVYKKLGIEHYQLPSVDFFPPELSVLEEGARLLDRELTEGRRVYIHCKSGKGRSASIVLAYFIRYRYTGLDLLACYQKLKGRRKEVFGASSPQMKRLGDFFTRCRSAAGKQM